MPKSKSSKYPREIVIAAKARRMRPDDYCHQMAECSMADQRMAEIDRKKLDEMQPEEPEPDIL
jgi:hypothetical protein